MTKEITLFPMFKSLAKVRESSYVDGHKQESATKVKEPLHCNLLFETTCLGK